MQYLFFLIAERYVIESNITAFRSFFTSLHFRFVHQRQDAPSGNGEISEFCKVGQCRSQRIEDAGTDNEEHNEREQG